MQLLLQFAQQHPLVIVMPAATAALWAYRHGSVPDAHRWLTAPGSDSEARLLVSYSETSGSIFAALRDALLRDPRWRLGPSPRQLSQLPYAERLRDVHLVLGDRYHMDGLIRDWKDQIHRFHRFQKAEGPIQEFLQAPKKVVLVNYYSGTKELSLKSNMVRNLRAHLDRPWDITPITYIVKPNSAGLKDQRDRFYREFDAAQQRNEGRIWIIKPARMNKAVGIRVMEDPDDILHYIDNHGERGDWVVQKYIERPFLIHGRKFDIRTWVVVGPWFDVWLWREGVLRTSSEPYNPFDLDNELSHMTNHCVQEKGPNFSKYELGNEMWYHQFQTYLDKYHHGYNFRERVIPRIKAIIKACFQSIKAQITHSVRSKTHELLCYQAFGIDFMMDDGFETWLIEINGQPAVAEALLPAFTRDTIELVVKPAFGIPRSRKNHSFELIDAGFEEHLKDLI